MNVAAGRARPLTPVVGAIGRRLAQLGVVVLGVSALTFFMLNLLPGDPALSVLGDNATAESVARFRAEYGLDRHIVVRYLDWLGHAARGDLGTSYISGNDVFDTIVDRVPVSLEIVLLSQFLAIGAALVAASIAVARRRTFVDKVLSMTSFAGLAVPSFLLAIVMIDIFAVRLGWFPASGFTRISDGLVDNLRTAALPSLTLAVAQYSVYMRLLRSDMLETAALDYVITAKGKGLTARRVLVRHVLRNSLFSLVTVAGVGFGSLLGGAVLTETIFAIPGVGRLLITAIDQRDLNTVQGVVLLIAAAYVFANAAVDVAYVFLDPRMRHGR